MFVRALPEIEISKSDLLSSAILLAIQTCIAKDIDIDEGDIERIGQLLGKASNRLRTLKGLTDGFRHLPLSEFFSSQIEFLILNIIALLFIILFLGRTKLRFLSLGINVIEEWVTHSKHESAEVLIWSTI